MSFADSRAGIAVQAEAWDRSSDGSGAELTELALAARTQDPLAMRRFLDAIAPSVRGVCRSVLGGRHVDLEDTVQDCLIEILRALPKYRIEGAVVHYTNRIALRAAIAARKRGRNQEQRLRALAEEASAFPSGATNDSMPNLQLVRELIDDLPPVQAEAILMRMVLGFSVEEIATATQVPVNTAKSRLRVGKDNLRRRLDSEAVDGVVEHEP